MGKVHNGIALGSVLFICGLLLTLMHPFDFFNKDIETLYHENEGLIWMVGIMIGVALMGLGYVNGVYQSELKDCANQNLEKNVLIQAQNVEIIKNQVESIRSQKEYVKAQKEYVIEMHGLSDQITKNFSQDNELIRKVDALTLIVTELSKTVPDLTERIEKIEKRNGG